KLLLWSCQTAAGARGSAFLEALESATGAEVRAATGTIGSQPLGGRWELNVSSGKETVAAPLTARGMAGYASVLAPPQKASLTAITTDSGTVGDFITNDNTPIFSGKEMRTSALGIWISGGIYGTGNGGKGTLIGTVPTDSSPGNNSWSFNYAGTALADGTYTVSLTDGSASGASALDTQTITIDTVAPGVPTISQVTDNVLPVTGVVANGGSTDDTTPTVRISLSGTNAAAGDRVQLFNGTSALGSAIVLTSSNISNGFVDVTPAALAQGTYNFNAEITDIAGNTTGASSNYTVTISGLSVTVSGTAQEGQTLTATPSGAVTGYQWQSFISGTWTNISGATSSTYVVQETNEGNQLRVHVTFSGGSADSAATSAVIDISPTLTTPVISGTAQQGQTLTATPAGADDSDATLSYHWGANHGSGITPIAAATTLRHLIPS